jgi:hypothetical protein
MQFGCRPCKALQAAKGRRLRALAFEQVKYGKGRPVTREPWSRSSVARRRREVSCCPLCCPLETETPDIDAADSRQVAWPPDHELFVSK